MCVGYPPAGLDEYEMEFCSCFVTYHYVWCMIPSWLDAFGTLLSYMKRNKSLQKKTTTLCSSLSPRFKFLKEREILYSILYKSFSESPCKTGAAG